MLKHKGTQTLLTQRLRLRQITPKDADSVFVWMSDPEVRRYERWSPHPSAEYSCGYIMEVCKYDFSDVYQWGIEADGALVGSVSVVNIDEHDRKATIGYCVAREHWSKGYATEAVREVLRYMFEEVQINRIEASHSINNVASGRVLQKSGMKREGFAKEYYRCSIGYQDSDLYGLTRSQYMRDK